jgi:ATP synthase protein I
MTNPKPPDDFDRRLATARERHVTKSRPRRRDTSMSGAAVGLRIAIEILAAVAVGVGIGLALDSWLETKPWLLIVFCILGFGGALVNVMRTAREMDRRRLEAKRESERSNSNVS